MDKTPTKKVTREPIHGSPVNHNILYQDVRNKVKRLDYEVELLLIRLTHEIGMDYMRRLLMDSYTTIYDMLEELVTPTSDAEEANKNSIIIISSDTEASKAQSVNQEIK